jgi:adenylyltransferase/sulfurtransferase
MLNDEALLRYSRHILLSEIDLDGQEKIQQSRILIVGCGGLGNAAAPLLVAAGVGDITLVDFDDIDLSNLQRQIHFETQDIGENKAEILKKHLHSLNPNVTIHAVTDKADEALLLDLTHNVDMILDCTDNFAIRQAINVVAHHYKIPLISGSAVRFEGQLAIYDFRDEKSGCYRCLFEGAHSDDGACALLGVFSPILQIMGAMQAQEALKIILGLEIKINQMKVYNALTGDWQMFKFARNPKCTVCHEKEVK